MIGKAWRATEKLVFGSALRIREHPVAFIKECAKPGADIARFRVFHKPVYLVVHPALIEQVLVTRSAEFVKSGREPSRALRLILRDELLARVISFPSDGQFWTLERGSYGGALSREQVLSYVPEIVDQAERFVDEWQDGQTIDMQQKMSLLALSTVARNLFGTTLSASDALVLNEAYEEIMHAIVRRMTRPMELPIFIPTRRNARVRDAVSTLQSFLTRARKEHLKDGQPRKDLLSIMEEHFRARTDVDDDYWEYQAISLFAAAYETTALTLSWACYLLAKNQSVQLVLLKELESVLGRESVSVHQLRRLEHASMVIKEALRLFPPVWSLAARRALKACQLGEYQIEKGDLILIAPYVTQRDARFFKAPEEFIPLRWNTPTAASPVHMYAYVPFGAGPRHCIGRSYAMVALVVTIATIWHRVRLEVSNDTAGDVMPLITLRSACGLPMTVRRRV